MKKLTYRNVFSKYSLSITDYLACLAYKLYKNARIFTSRWFPLTENEAYSFNDQCFSPLQEHSSDMPQGFSYTEEKTEDGFIKLDYIDFFDYLPKENLNSFKKAADKFVSKNRTARFSSFISTKDLLRIDNMGRYIDCRASTNLYSVVFTNNRFLEKNAPQVCISLQNLSPSFLVICYRLYISKEFNQQINTICKKKYPPYTEIVRQYNTPWYKPKQFGQAFFSGDNAREKCLYESISKLKWFAFKELSKYFTINFAKHSIFPPTFETYSTNIRPDKSGKNQGFWNSVSLGYHPDYAPELNLCVGWERKVEQNEGIQLISFCGGDYSRTNYQGISQHHLAESYAVYMVAHCLQRIAERDIAICNKQISHAIQQLKTSLILKTRVIVDQKLYYCYRFISEFSGDTLDRSKMEYFKSQICNEGSITSRSFNHIATYILETKKQIDNLLHILDNAAEYGNAKSNMDLQWFMMIVTVLSLVVAIIALLGITPDNIFNFIDNVTDWIRELVANLPIF